LASVLFSWFIGLSSRYSLVYGSLASVIILMVWLYLCGNILILGNCVNRVWYGRKKSRAQGHIIRREEREGHG
ncbi:MAG: YhjD/YihY/BrkB family envelope integrity protein, partial [Pseudoflavonifractor sp.]|nr:YhjD/YihY/BrkB family envelope integrity protein [Pseudoflavonifractor sp.]